MPRRLPSPYNFVPVTGWIFYPPWAGQVSHDVPFTDGICGSLSVTATARTPVFIRRGKSESGFYQVYPGGPYAIPGSSFKGLIRSVVEIVGYGKLGRLVNDKRRLKGNRPVTEDIRQKIAKTLPPHAAPWPPDLAETIFGFAEGEQALRGRVAFDPLRAPPKTQPEGIRNVTLESSAGSCAPYYLEPRAYDAKDGAVSPGDLPKFDDGDSILRGWKRYPVYGGADKNPPLGRSPVPFFPLPENTTFTGCIRVHNLRPVELGALVWAITWGGDQSRRHSLGLAKPFRFGGVTFALATAPGDLERIDGQPVDLSVCQSEFITLMEDFMRTAHPGGWAGSEPLRHLLAMADPAAPPPAALRYAIPAELEHAKTDGQTLLPYIRPGQS